MSRELDKTFDNLFNEIKKSKNSNVKLINTPEEKKENKEDKKDLGDNDYFSYTGSKEVEIDPTPTIKIKPQSETEFSHINVREFYYKKFSEISDIKDIHFSQQVKMQGIDPNIKLTISLGELTCIVDNGSANKVMPISSLYQKLFKGSDPSQDLLEYNLEMDKQYAKYCESEAKKAFPTAKEKEEEAVFSDEEKTEYIKDVFGDDDPFVSVAKDVLGGDGDIEVKKEDNTTVVTKSKRGRPKKQESLENTQEVDFNNSVVLEGELVNYKEISGKIPNISISNLEVEKTASLLSHNPTKSETQNEGISNRDFEGFARVFEAIARKLLSQ